MRWRWPAGRLLRRVHDFAAVAGRGEIDDVAADAALVQLEVDRLGLDAMDRRYMRCLADAYGGGPAGAEALAATLAEQRDVLEEVVEPYLIREALVLRTPRGRMLSRQGWECLGLTPPRSAADLFDGA